MFTAANYQANNLPETGSPENEWNKEKDQLNQREREVVMHEYHSDSAKRHHDLRLPQRIGKNCKNLRVVAGSGTNALNFDHVSPLG